MLEVEFHDNSLVSDVYMAVPDDKQNRDLVSGYKPDLDRITVVIQESEGRGCSQKVMIAFTLQMDNFA